jgi:MbtH protein
MPNPFEDNEGFSCALINDEGQCSLWPAAAEVPTGWKIMADPSIRKDCLEYIEANRTEMRPRSLVASLKTADAP